MLLILFPTVPPEPPRSFPLAGLPQSFPGAAFDSYPLTAAQSYPLAEAQPYPLANTPQTYPLQ
jgi:hypothetical protein